MDPIDWANLTFVAWALLLIRFAMLPLVVYNIAWSFRSCVDFIMGRNFPASLYESMVFFMSMGLMGYHLLSFLGRTTSDWSHSYSLALQCFFFLASLVAAIGRRLAMTVDFEKFYWLFKDNHLEMAIRIAEINHIDPEFAEETLSKAEKAMTSRLAKGLVNRGNP